MNTLSNMTDWKLIIEMATRQLRKELYKSAWDHFQVQDVTVPLSEKKKALDYAFNHPYTCYRLFL